MTSGIKFNLFNYFWSKTNNEWNKRDLVFPLPLGELHPKKTFQIPCGRFFRVEIFTKRGTSGQDSKLIVVELITLILADIPTGNLQPVVYDQRRLLDGVGIAIAFSILTKPGNSTTEP